MFVAWSGLLSWVQITDVGRSFYIGSFCPAMTSLSRYLEEAVFSISISSSVLVVFKVYYGHSFFYCFHFMSFVKDMFREIGFAFCIPEVFPMFFFISVNLYLMQGSSYRVITSQLFIFIVVKIILFF